jgi:hypothetical protein
MNTTNNTSKTYDETLDDATNCEILDGSIAVAAMELMIDGYDAVDATFIAAVDIANEFCNKPWARAYGLAHWAELSDDSKRCWDYVFGRGSRLPGWMTRDLTRLNRIAECEDVDV